MTIIEARAFLAPFKRICETSPGFGDSEVRYYDGPKLITEGYIGRGDSSNITVDGTEFRGSDAYQVMKR